MAACVKRGDLGSGNGVAAGLCRWLRHVLADRKEADRRRPAAIPSDLALGGHQSFDRCRLRGTRGPALPFDSVRIHPRCPVCRLGFGGMVSLARGGKRWHGGDDTSLTNYKMASLTVDYRVWKKALMFGEHNGCRPAPEMMERLRQIEAHEQKKIDDRKWVGYLLPSLEHIDDNFASCLSSALTSAIEQLRDPSLGLRHAVNGADSPILSKGGIHTEDIEGFEAVRDWCLRGAFAVEWRQGHSVFSR